VVKILSQSGMSLADIYDVEGSVAGVEQLLSHDVNVVHELGGTILSERLTGALLRITSGAISQSAAYDVVITAQPGIQRVLGVLVFADDESRVDRAAVLARDNLAEREIPIFSWDTNEGTIRLRLQDDGAAVADHDQLVSVGNMPNFPTLLIGTGQPGNLVNQLALRGASNAFGAGTVVITAVIYIAHTNIDTAGLSSIGVPIPGW